MNEYRLITISSPAVEPVTLDEAKAHLRLDITDDDATVTSLITAARICCETFQRQAYITQTHKLLFDYGASAYGVQLVGGGYYNRNIRAMGLSPFWLPVNAIPIELPRPPLQSIVSFQYVDNSTGSLLTLDPSIYNVALGTPGRIQPVYGQTWPIPRPQIDAVQITFTAGYGDTAAAVPENVKAAMKLLIGHWYENREAAVIGQTVEQLPMAVNALLSATDHGAYT